MTGLHRVLWMAGLPVRSLLVGLIRVYQGTLGRVVGGRCRFYPSCSAYALEAVHTHGAFKGGLLALWRIARCNPLGAGGVDRVPQPEVLGPGMTRSYRTHG